MSGQGKSSDGMAAAMERLEDRLLLDTGPVVIGDGEGAVARSLIYRDADGTQVTVALKGGTATINWQDPDTTWSAAGGVAVVGAGPEDTAEIDLIELAGTTALSSLTFKTKVPRGLPDADRYASIGGIVGAAADTAIGTISAPNVVFTGFDDDGETVGIRLQGGVRTCVIDRVFTGGVEDVLFELGGTSGDTLKFVAPGGVESASLNFGGTLTQLATRYWGGGTVTVGAAGRIATTSGSFGADLVATAGSIGSVTVVGGDLTGSLTAGNGAIGAIKVTAKAVIDDPGGAPQGLVVGGNLMGNITVGAIKGKSIASITVTGGTIGEQGQAVEIRAAGSVGPIINKGMRFRDFYEDDNGRTRSFSNYQMVDVYLDLISTSGAVGRIAVTGGGFSGAVTANGAVAGVTVAAARIYFPMDHTTEYVGGAFDGRITAASIGPVSATGGNLTGNLSAPVIGNVTCKVITVSARLVRTVFDGEVMFDVFNGEAYGGNVTDLTLSMTAEGARLGSITAIGGSLSVQGQVSFDPLTARLVSKPARYVSTYEENDAGRMAPVSESLGGPGSVDISNLVQV